MVSCVTIAYCLLAEGFGVAPESSTSLLSAAYFVLLFTTTFDSGSRLFLLIAFSVAVHFKQHSSLTYQNPSFFIGQRTGGSRNCGNWLRFATPDNKTTSSAAATCSLVALLSAKHQAELKILLHYYITKGVRLYV